MGIHRWKFWKLQNWEYLKSQDDLVHWYLLTHKVSYLISCFHAHLILPVGKTNSNYNKTVMRPFCAIMIDKCLLLLYQTKWGEKTKNYNFVGEWNRNLSIYVCLLTSSVSIMCLSVEKVSVLCLCVWKFKNWYRPRSCKRSNTLFQKSLLLFSTWRNYFYSQPKK